VSLEPTLDVAVDPAAVEFALAVANAGTDPVELTFRSGRVADFAVSADGEPVWRWSDGRAFTQAIRTETLDPGESVTGSGRWEDPAPGEYAVAATLAAADRELIERATFEV